MIKLELDQKFPFVIQNDAWKNCKKHKNTCITSNDWIGKYNWDKWSRIGKILLVKTESDDNLNSEKELNVVCDDITS